MEKKSILQITELPKRTEKLSPEKLQQIFGGTGGHCSPCAKESDCTGQLYCRGNEYNGFYCVSWGESTYYDC